MYHHSVRPYNIYLSFTKFIFDNVQKIVHLQQPPLFMLPAYISKTFSRFWFVIPYYWSFFIDIVCIVAILSTIFPAPYPDFLNRILSVCDSRGGPSCKTDATFPIPLVKPYLAAAVTGTNAFEKQLKLKYSAFIRFTFECRDKPKISKKGIGKNRRIFSK